MYISNYIRHHATTSSLITTAIATAIAAIATIAIATIAIAVNAEKTMLLGGIYRSWVLS